MSPERGSTVGRVEAPRVSGYISGNISGGSPMADSQRNALATYRRRMRGKGFLRLEVQVRKEDAALIRSIVGALVDPALEAEARALLKERFSRPPTPGLKALLAAAPLEGIELKRPRARDRDIDL